MFVGATGVGRVVERTAALMREHDTDDVTPFGGINLDTVQRYLNLHYSLSLDLFGSDVSTNAANYFTAGLKGRFHETERDDDHRLLDAVTTVLEPSGDRIVEREVPALTSLNADLRTDYIDDCAKGVSRWNRALQDVGRELTLPHAGFNRRVGPFAGHRVSPDGRVVSESEWADRLRHWLPTDEDRDHVASVMQPVYEPGKFAAWVAAPSAGVNAKPIDYEYVKL